MSAGLKVFPTAAAAAAACGFAWWAWNATSEPDLPPVALGTVVAPGPLAPVPPPAKPAPKPVTPGHDVQRYLALNTPQAALDAYKLLDQCYLFKWIEHHGAISAQHDYRESIAQALKQMDGACEGMNASEVLRRHELVVRAAEAGVFGAASRMLGVGPHGDATAWAQRPDDPIVKEWNSKVVALLKASAKRGDEEALLTLASIYAPNGDEPDYIVKRDRGQAVMYWAAIIEARKHRGQWLDDKKNAALFANVGQGLTPEQLALATKAGRDYAVGCCIR